jgi:hypothetical protein
MVRGTQTEALMKQGSSEDRLAKRSGSEQLAQRRGAHPLAAPLLTLGLALAGLLSAPEAHASSTFPGKIEKLAHLPCTPTCLLCHTDPNGEIKTLRAGPMKEPWALSTFLFLNSSDGTQADLDKLAGQDTDHDGVNDLPELQAGQNPFLTGDSPYCSDIRYGCGARIASKPVLDGSTAAWLLSAAAACVYAGRRRFKSRAR